MATDPIVRTYDPKLIAMTFGPVIFFGYAEGTFVTVARNGNAFEKSKGADGSIDRVNKNAFDGSITVTLKQTSPTNDALSVILAQDMLTNTGKYPFLIKDLNGTTLIAAAQAWIEKDPDDEFSDGLSTREWVFATGPMEKFTGGNIL